MKIIDSEIVKTFFTLPDFMLGSYLEDMSDDELLESKATYVNHWNWQFGHLLYGEHYHMKTLQILDPLTLPEGFLELYSPEGISSNKNEFFSKEKLLEIKGDVRSYTLEVLDGLPVEQLCSPTPEALQYLGPNILSVFASEVGHWMHHLGQLAVIRKSLGKKTF